MNEFDFQNGDFLDNLFTASSHASAQISMSDDASLTSTTTSAASFRHHDDPAVSTVPSEDLVSSSLNPKSNSAAAASLSFPPNFYTEVQYEDESAKTLETASEESGHHEAPVEPSSHTDNGAEAEESQIEEPEIDIAINNVVCSFAVRCHLNLRKIAMEASNVVYKREHGVRRLTLFRPKAAPRMSSDCYGGRFTSNLLWGL